MPQLLKALLFASLLTASACSPKREAPSFQPPPPAPPAALLIPCVPTPFETEPDGSMTAAQVLRALSLGLVDLYDCDNRRKAGAEAWPKAVDTPQSPPDSR